jgi:hypothetical protein
MSGEGGAKANDRIVRSFSVRHDAYMYVKELNMAANEQVAQPEKRRL